jgi:hypothetical protein
MEGRVSVANLLTGGVYTPNLDMSFALGQAGFGKPISDLLKIGAVFVW